MNIRSQFGKLKAIIILSGKKIGNNMRHDNSQNGNINANFVYLVTTDTFKYFFCEATLYGTMVPEMEPFLEPLLPEYFSIR